MVRQDEEDRARAFRQSLQRRERAERARNATLTGNAAAAKAIRDGWEPVLLARLEREATDHATEDCDE